MKHLIQLVLTAFLCLNLHAQNTDSLVCTRYTYSKVLSLAKFHELRYLKLYAYEDSILPEILDQLPNLEYLEINNSPITQIPKSIGSLSKLKTLIVCNGYCPIRIPPEIGQLTQLTKLQLYNYKFTQIPSETGKLVNLENVIISGDLTDLPASVSNWKKLKNMYLSGNQFRKIPSPIFQLTQLEYLDLSRNKLSYLSDSIRVLKNLDKLGLEGNIELEQLPPLFCELEKLEELSIQNTKIHVLPSCLNQIAPLKRIRMCSTLIDEPDAFEAAFGKKIDWDWSCRGLERSLVNHQEIYGTYRLSMKNKKDTLSLYCYYTYNEPGTIDEEYTQTIILKVLQKDSLQLNRIYNATNPHFSISAVHASVWDWDAEPKKQITGYIQFMEISKKRVKAYLNLDLNESWGKRKLVDKYLTFE